MSLVPFLLYLALLAEPVLSADILAVLPFPQYSHVMPFMPILKALGQRGHNITLITAFEQNPNPPGFTQVKVNITTKDFHARARPQGGPPRNARVARGPVFQLSHLFPMCGPLSTLILEKTLPLLPPPGTKFDLVIVEPFFCMEPLVATSVIYNAPIVVASPMALTPYTASVTGNPMATSYVPILRIPFTSEMTFLERVWNVVASSSELLLANLYHLPAMDKKMRDTFGRPELPYIGDIFHNISLTLLESHFTLNYPRPYFRNVLEVGGTIAIRAADPLPKDLETYMNEAKDGVIYFSWGSHFEADDVDKALQVMMKTFSKLKQRVVFKWHADIPNKPDNVLVRKWLPQPSVLAHKNTLFFISHGGLNSAYEAMYNGVPILGTPIFGDQPYNIRLLESLGVAVEVDFDKLDDGVTFPAAVDIILRNPSFRENAKRRSELLRDRPMDVVKEAVYWVEYVLKHGASHLQPVTQRMPWYSVAQLDVALFLVAILAGVLSLFYFSIAFCLSLCWRKPAKAVPKKKKTQ